MKNFADRIAALNEYEHQGFNVCMLRNTKELMQANLDMAEAALCIMDFAGLVWGADLKATYAKFPLSCVGMFFYELETINTIEAFCTSQIHTTETEILQARADMLACKKSKSAQKWGLDKIQRAHAYIDLINLELEKYRIANKSEIWAAIPAGAEVEFTTPNKPVQQQRGVMVKGDFRTHSGSYAYINNQTNGSYTINEVLTVHQLLPMLAKVPTAPVEVPAVPDGWDVL